ncbi:hypothetical protein [Nesterenkonia alba]|uniref:hypothetical protein n=1 Tax=Nesterenkonia alba TaxID=515814 RepID=UPI0003B67C8B|nr:hypothetical protein [Nesterenkonia alba]
MNLPVFAQLVADQYNGYELFMPAEWFGIIMFVVLMASLLVTLAFSNKNRSPQASPDSEQGAAHH